jgi:hypothetical protein
MGSFEAFRPTPGPPIGDLTNMAAMESLTAAIFGNRVLAWLSPDEPGGMPLRFRVLGGAVISSGRP